MTNRFFVPSRSVRIVCQHVHTDGLEESVYEPAQGRQVRATIWLGRRGNHVVSARPSKVGEKYVSWRGITPAEGGNLLKVDLVHDGPMDSSDDQSAAIKGSGISLGGTLAMMKMGDSAVADPKADLRDMEDDGYAVQIGDFAGLGGKYGRDAVKVGNHADLEADLGLLDNDWESTDESVLFLADESVTEEEEVWSEGDIERHIGRVYGQEVAVKRIFAVISMCPAAKEDMALLQEDIARKFPLGCKALQGIVKWENPEHSHITREFIDPDHI